MTRQWGERLHRAVLSASVVLYLPWLALACSSSVSPVETVESLGWKAESAIRATEASPFPASNVPSNEAAEHVAVGDCPSDVEPPPEGSIAERSGKAVSPGLELRVVPDRVVEGASAPTLVYDNRGNTAVEYGLTYALECWVGEEWRRTPPAPAPAIGLGLEPGGTSPTVGEANRVARVQGWRDTSEGPRPVPLGPGWYRVTASASTSCIPDEAAGRGCPSQDLFDILQVTPAGD